MKALYFLMAATLTFVPKSGLSPQEYTLVIMQPMTTASEGSRFVRDLLNSGTTDSVLAHYVSSDGSQGDAVVRLVGAINLPKGRDGKSFVPARVYSIGDDYIPYVAPADQALLENIYRFYPAATSDTEGESEDLRLRRTLAVAHMHGLNRIDIISDGSAYTDRNVALLRDISAEMRYNIDIQTTVVKKAEQLVSFLRKTNSKPNSTLIVSMCNTVYSEEQGLQRHSQFVDRLIVDNNKRNIDLGYSAGWNNLAYTIDYSFTQQPDYNGEWHPKTRLLANLKRLALLGVDVRSTVLSYDGVTEDVKETFR